MNEAITTKTAATVMAMEIIERPAGCEKNKLNYFRACPEFRLTNLGQSRYSELTMNAIATNQAKAISVPTLFEYSIPRTDDAGDAMLAAQRILSASYSYCLSAGDQNVPSPVRTIVYDSKEYIGKQYANWLKGATQSMSGRLVITGMNGTWVPFNQDNR